MSMDPDLRRLLTDVIQVKKKSAVSDGGDPVMGAATPIKALIDYQPQLVRNSLGEQIVSPAMFITEQAVDITDRIWLPGENPDTDVGHEVKKAFNVTDPETGLQHHAEVYL